MSPVPLAQLRARVAALEGVGRESVAGIQPFGVAEIDRILPWGGAPLGCLHEIASVVRADEAEHGAALGFAALWLGRLAAGQGRPVLWVAERDDLYAPGLAALGLPVERLLVVRPKGAAQALWALEQGLQCRGVAGVLGEVWGLDFTAARRLQLAARASGVTALVVNRGEGTGTALTRWRVGPAPSEGPAEMGVGAWRWRLELCRCRGRGTGGDGCVATWLVEWNDETRCLRVAAPAGDRSAGAEMRRVAG